MGDMLKKILTNKRKKILILLIVLIVVFVTIIFSTKYVVTIDEGTYTEDMSNVPYVVDITLKEALQYGDEESEGDQVRIVERLLGGYKYDINLDDIVDDIIETLDKHDGNLDVYLTPKNKKKYLKKMIKAELVTQYPNLGGTAPDESFQGAINFYRYKVDGTNVQLEYIPLGSEGDTSSDTLYGLINAKNANVLNYFSLDETGNLVVATYSETRTAHASGSYSTEYVESGEVDYYDNDIENIPDISTAVPEITYNAKKINYKTLISNYTMPFEYLWAFMVCGEDEKFVSNLADLVLGNEDEEITPSKIDIGIYDSLITTETITIDSYNDNTWQREGIATRRIDTREITGVRWGSNWENYRNNVTTKHNYNITYTQNKDNSITNLAIIYLDIWYMRTRERMEYAQEPVEPTNPGFANRQTQWNPESDEEFLDPSYPYESVPLIPIGPWTEISSTHEEGRVKQKQEGITNQHATSFAENREESKYRVQGTPEVEEKTSKEKDLLGRYKEKNFCTLFLQSSARNNIEGTESWLFEIIENNETTVDMLNLTKYMLYMSTGTKFGVTEENMNFSLHSPIDLTSVSGVYGSIDVHDTSLFPTSKEQFLQGLHGQPSYVDNEVFNDYAEYYIKYQEDYQVNAFFAVAVAIMETGGGRAGYALNGQNNLYHIRGDGPGGFRRYASKKDSIKDFYKLIAEGTYYYNSGRYTIHDIGHTYCPNTEQYPTQGDHWVSTVSGIVTSFINAAGIELPVVGGSFAVLEGGLEIAGIELGRPLLGSWRVTDVATPRRLHPTLGIYRPHHGVDVGRSTSWNTNICSSSWNSKCCL